MLTVESRSTILDTAALPIHERIAFFTSLCRLQSGVVICGFQIGPCKHAATSTIGLCISSDEGRSWERLPTRFETAVGGVPGELGTAELIEVSPGRLLLFSTWFDRSEPDRPLFDPVTEGILHSKQLMAVSSDHGRSWSPWRQISTGDLKGCALTGPCVRWHDGRIAMAFESFKEFDDLAPRLPCCLGDHVHQEHAALTQGHENIDFRLYWEDMAKWSFGHPAICRIDAETVLLAWYAGSPDCMSLHSARVRIA